LLNFIIGLFMGGLSLSAGWGLFWLGIGLMGLRRGTCGWRVVRNSFAAGLVPLLLIIGLLWWRGGAGEASLPFGMGFLGLPMLLLGLGLRPAPDGQQAGIHMLMGVRHLMDEILGNHHGCGGCAHEHDPEGCA
jgi:hypothetical protein